MGTGNGHNFREPDKTPCQDILIENNTFTDYPRGVGNHHGCDAFPGLYSSNIKIRNNTFKDMYVTTPNGKKLYEYAITLHSFANAVVENNTIENAGSAVWNLIEKVICTILKGFFRLINKEFSDNALENFMQFIKFGIVGLSNTIISYILYVVSLLIIRKLGIFGTIDI